jgi:hypothetical protein
LIAESVRPSVRAGRRLPLREDRAALLLLLTGLSVRLLAAQGSSLSGDEALHFQLASAPDAAAVYRISLTNAHPPLFLLLLHFWRLATVSEWGLRLLPVAFGAAFLWAAYRWTASLLGKGAGLGALALAAFLPPLVSLSAEVRAYALLLLLAAAALWQLERAFESGSPGRVALSAALFALAILTHYAALRVTAAAFVYAAVRLLRQRGPRRLAAAWAAGQAGIGALFLFLYATHLSRLRGNALEREARADWLRTGYLHAGESPLRFAGRQTLSLFEFLCSSRAAGFALLGLTIAGIWRLARSRRAAAALLLGSPFVFAAAGGLLGLYPFAGTRHSIDVALFAAAAAGAAVAPLLERSPWAALALAAALLPAGLAAARQPARDRPLEPMRRAIRELRSAAPAGAAFFVDSRTAALLGFSLGQREHDATAERPDRFRERRAGGYRILSSPIWRFDGEAFSAELRRGLAARALPRGEPVWLFQADWGYSAAAEVSRAAPGASFPSFRRFDRIALTEALIP